jgi:hypothetical protein
MNLFQKSSDEEVAFVERRNREGVFLNREECRKKKEKMMKYERTCFRNQVMKRLLLWRVQR